EQHLAGTEREVEHADLDAVVVARGAIAAESLCHFGADEEREVERQTARFGEVPFKERVEAHTFDQLQHEVRLMPPLAEVLDLDDVGVTNAGAPPRGTSGSRERALSVIARHGTEDLDRDEPPEAAAALEHRTVDGGRRPSTQHADQPSVPAVADLQEIFGRVQQ
ncbi:MAG TPA: hypothetical protein VLT33_06075, partial [Labilithrix sp.]|nr:hypothetical protein [Labilithrix sp.]